MVQYPTPHLGIKNCYPVKYVDIELLKRATGNFVYGSASGVVTSLKPHAVIPYEHTDGPLVVI